MIVKFPFEAMSAEIAGVKNLSDRLNLNKFCSIIATADRYDVHSEPDGARRNEQRDHHSDNALPRCGDNVAGRDRFRLDASKSAGIIYEWDPQP
jgi:hypothetical protein